MISALRTRRCIALLAAIVCGALAAGVPVLPAAAAAGPSTRAADATADCGPSARFNPRLFASQQRIDNRWLPMPVGLNYRLSGTVVSDGETHRHEIVATVSTVTKVMAGIRTRVVFERDYDNGRLQESELAFMAQDRPGRVWNVGEYPEEYADGRLEGAPSTWIAALAGAQAGVGMQAHPRVGTPAYLQGVAPAVDFRDCGRVIRTGQRVCVPVGCFGNVLVTDEWAPLEPRGGFQRKYYAPSVGLIRVQAIGGDTPEDLQLTSRSFLGTRALAAIRTEVLRQDHRGYRISPTVYGRTRPAS